MVSVMPAERLSCLVIKLLKSELVLDARCGTNTYGLLNTATFTAFAKFSPCKDALTL
jgi:hypothetical protein